MMPLFQKFVLGLVLLAFATVSLKAQTFTNLHNFAAIKQDLVTYAQTNQDGGNVYAPMVVSGSALYGTTAGGGTNGLGTIFKINLDGSGFTNIFTFSFIKNQPTNGDNGSGPLGGLLLSGNTLYGTTREGGLLTNYCGSVFAINTNGTGFTNLHYFSTVISNTNSDGAFPDAGLVLLGSKLYGTTYSGGKYGDGAIFAINTDSTGFTNLHSFDMTDGANPEATLAYANNMLFGTTYLGGANTNGIIFAISPDGLTFTNYHSFSARGFPYSTNYDGAYPQSPLVAVGNKLYGTASLGGGLGNGYGTLFSINTDGSGFAPVYYFDFSHGAAPYCQLLSTNNLLYGTTTEGGAYEAGTVFEVNNGGTSYTDLYDFPLPVYSGSAYTNSTGAEPWAGVAMSGSTLYGGTPTGGTGGAGTLYALILAGSAPVPLVEMFSGTSLVLSWSAGSYSLQAASSITGTFTNVPGAVSPYTVGTTNQQQFFRLQAN